MAEAEAGKFTNRMFAEKSPEFRAACTSVGLSPTKRQASKWRHRRGAAYHFAEANEILRFYEILVEETE